MISFLKIQWQLKHIDAEYLSRLVEIGRITEEQKDKIMNQTRAAEE